MKRYLSLLLLTLLLLIPAARTHAGQFNVDCTYSHTLPDDPILMPNMPGMSMVHDFLGNTNTNAYTVNADLLSSPTTTCENKGDSTGYWVPQLRRAGGTQIVAPTYQKTYYRAINPTVYPVAPFPAGIQLIAGNPLATAPSTPITYYCKYPNGSYTQTAPTACGVDPVKGAQFNIGIVFPDCWDGHTMSPSFTYRNAVYSNNGACPANYPVHIPQLNFNIVYLLGSNGDLSDAQLSIDPVMVNGQLQPQWGSIYGAHADFMNGWQPAATQYMVTYCLNPDLACDKAIPYTYAESSADAWISSAAANINYGSSTSLFVEGGTAPLDTTLMRFAIPPETAGMTFSHIYLRVFGGNVTDTTAFTIYAYALGNSWNENSVTWNNAPACGAQVGSLYLNNVLQYRNIAVTAAVQSAIAQGQTQISFCIKGPGGTNGRTVQLSSRESANKPVLY